MKKGKQNNFKGKMCIRRKMANKDQFSNCQRLFHNEIKSAELIKVVSALLQQTPDHCESNHRKTKEECNELAGKGITGFHFCYFL